MHEPTYRPAIVHAWKLVWHHKTTWILGLLTVLLGQFGLSDFIGQLIAKFVSSDASWWPASWGAIHIATPEQFFWFGWALFILVAIGFFVVAATVCAQGALIATAIHWYNVHTILPLRKAWRQGVKHFWRILAINVLEKLLLAVVLALVVELSSFFTLSSNAGLAALALIMGVGLFVAMAISVIAVYALGYVMVEDRPVIEGVGLGWTLFHNHLMVSFELSALVVLGNLILLAAAYVGALIVLIPSFIISLVAGFSGLAGLFSVATVVYLFLVVVVVAVVAAVYTAFTTSAWIYLFMKMYHEGVKSRLFHWVRTVFQRSPRI